MDPVSRVQAHVINPFATSLRIKKKKIKKERKYLIRITVKAKEIGMDSLS